MWLPKCLCPQGEPRPPPSSPGDSPGPTGVEGKKENVEIVLGSQFLPNLLRFSYTEDWCFKSRLQGLPWGRSG